MSVTPEFLGQKYTDKSSGNVWNANSLTPGDWSKQVQDLGIQWTPTSINLATRVALVAAVASGPVMSGITSISINPSSILRIEILEANDLLSISSNALITVDDQNLDGKGILIEQCASLATVSMPSITTLSNGYISIISNPLLTSIDLSGVVTVGLAGGGWYGFNIGGNTNLTTVDVSSYVPENDAYFSANVTALNAASVNMILARHVAVPGYVSGTIDLSGGTVAAPTGQGIADKATLLGRGVTLTTN